VNLVEGGLRWVGEAGFLCVGSDLLLREAVELLAGLPHVDDPNPVVSFGHPVKETAGQMSAARSEAHLLDHLVVLLERCSLCGPGSSRLPSGTSVGIESDGANLSDSPGAIHGERSARQVSPGAPWNGRWGRTGATPASPGASARGCPVAPAVDQTQSSAQHRRARACLQRAVLSLAAPVRVAMDRLDSGPLVRPEERREWEACCHYKIQPRGLDGTRIFGEPQCADGRSADAKDYALIILSDEVVSAVARFLEAGRGPSHDEFHGSSGGFRLEAADPQKLFPGEQIGKMKRGPRGALAAIDTNAPAEVGDLRPG